MLEFSRKTNLLEQSAYRYTLQDVKEPNFYRHLYDYANIPKVPFNHRIVPMNTPDQIWITDTTFRDGQQACSPFTVDQIVRLFQLLHKLGGPNGLVRQSEFFLYTEKDKQAVTRCMELGYEFPEVTSWIRANEKDFQLVKDMGLRETGILVSCSDYHIFKKMNLNRSQAMEKYLGIVRSALEHDILPRCHFEDITRADFYGFVVPFANELMKLARESQKLIKIRACDTLGYAVSYPGAALPRSVPGIIYGLQHYSEVPSECLEWHGHNDFYKVLTNATTAWLYGCAAANGALLGFGERTGNTPVEALVIEYISLKGESDGMETAVITEIAEFFQKEIGFNIPANTPFVGRDFNSTSAGIHVDGLLKNPEIYNIFDTEAILGRPITIAITDKSGAAGVAHWINQRLKLAADRVVDKRHPGVVKITQWVQEQYEQGRLTTIGNSEMEQMARKYLPDLFHSEFDRLKFWAQTLAMDLGTQLTDRPEMKTMAPAVIEPVLEEFLQQNPFIQFLYVVNTNGYMITRNITHITDKAKYGRVNLDMDYSDREWFVEPLKDGKVHVTDFYTSRITGALCITVSGPIRDEKDAIVGVLGADIRFEDLAKIEAQGNNKNLPLG